MSLRTRVVIIAFLLTVAGCAELSGLRLCVDMPTFSPAPSASASATSAPTIEIRP
jgi:hypothetical protein